MRRTFVSPIRRLSTPVVGRRRDHEVADVRRPERAGEAVARGRHDVTAGAEAERHVGPEAHGDAVADRGHERIAVVGPVERALAADPRDPAMQVDDAVGAGEQPVGTVQVGTQAGGEGDDDGGRGAVREHAAERDDDRLVVDTWPRPCDPSTVTAPRSSAPRRAMMVLSRRRSMPSPDSFRAVIVTVPWSRRAATVEADVDVVGGVDREARPMNGAGDDGRCGPCLGCRGRLDRVRHGYRGHVRGRRHEIVWRGDRRRRGRGHVSRWRIARGDGNDEHDEHDVEGAAPGQRVAGDMARILARQTIGGPGCRPTRDSPGVVSPSLRVNAFVSSGAPMG